MAFRYLTFVAAAVTTVGIPISAIAEEESSRRIEEIVVTAEKRESTVSDTSISITAFGEDMIEDFGIQGPDDLVDFIPSTTRDAYDIRIRGVGRNFRALGGDPGVATYYNGVYSEDFGIAATENGLYDVQRVEVLRGPQGTLYGRNSIGGALNYINNAPSYETEMEIRGLFGNLGAKEFYGYLSGPLIEDRLAYRLVALRRDRDGIQEGLAGQEDIDTIGDQNIAVSLNWKIADNWESNLRWNDRRSDRIIGQGSIVSEGAGTDRGVRSTNILAFGLIPDAAGPIGFTDPVTGAAVNARYARPGIDISSRTNVNGTYFGTDPSVNDQGQRFDPDTKDLEGWVATNSENDEVFNHNAVQFDLSWDINETTTMKYIGGWMDFDYTFDIDLDYTSGTLSQYRQTVLEAVETYSHELQLLWQIGDNLQMTSGLYYFNSDRLQNYAFRDAYNQGRYTRAANYGGFNAFVVGPHTRRGSAPVGGIVIGRWEGDPTGSPYEYWNTVETDAYAAYTQGTYTFNDQWALTLGIRWAEDKKEAFEERTGYFEQSPVSFVGSNPGCGAIIGQPAGALPCSAIGLTPLAWSNVIMGNALPTFNPASPIISTCAGGNIADPNCLTPVRLQGIPYSFADAAEGDDSWDDITYRVNLDWTPNDDTLVYASVTTGYRAGGYSLGIGDSREATPSGRVPLTYDKETVMAYELGYKGTFADGALQFNASWYLYDYNDYQDRVEQFNPGSQGSIDVVVNADEAENMGIELEATWLATDNWTIGGNYSWADTEYKSDFFVLEDDNPFLPIGLFPDGDDPATPYGQYFIHNLKGNALKKIPEHKATVWSFYDFRFGPGSLSVGGSYSYTGDYYDSGLERSLDKVPERHRLDLSATWRDSAERLTIRAFVDNVTDEGATRDIGTTTDGSNFRQTAAYLYPRFYGVDVRYELSHLFN